jgi:ribosomal protein L35AE/L33A
MRTLPVVSSLPFPFPPPAQPLYDPLPFDQEISADPTDINWDDMPTWTHSDIMDDMNSHSNPPEQSTHVTENFSEQSANMSPGHVHDDENIAPGNPLPDYVPSDVESDFVDNEDPDFDLEHHPVCLKVSRDTNPGTSYWPGANEMEDKFLQIFAALRRCMSRDNLRKVWPLITSLRDSKISVTTCERRLARMPMIHLKSQATSSKDYTNASLKDTILQAVATPSSRNLLVQLPVRSESVREFEHTKRFSDMHRQIRTASVQTAGGRFFVGDIACYYMSEGHPLIGKICEIYSRHGSVHVEMQRAMDYFGLQEDLQSHLPAPRPEDGNLNLLLRWNSPDVPELHQIHHSSLLQVVPRTCITLIGNVIRTATGHQVIPTTERQQQDILWMHPAVRFARDRDLPIILAPISVFSDETSGNVSKQYNKYESCTFTFSNMPREKRAQNIHSHILSTSNGIHAMEQLDTVAEDLLDMETGIVGIDGATGRQAIIVSPVAAFLGDNPRQSDVCSHRGMVAHANCRFCMRTRQQQAWQLGAQRTRRYVRLLSAEISHMMSSQLSIVRKDGAKLQRKTGVQGDVNKLLLLKYCNPLVHTPIELLHTALLGVARYLVAELQMQIRENGPLTPEQRSTMSAWIETTDRRDAPNHVTAANLIEFSNSFVGREYKLIMEYGFYLFRRVLTKRSDGEEDLPPYPAGTSSGRNHVPDVQEDDENIARFPSVDPFQSDAEEDENDDEEEDVLETLITDEDDVEGDCNRSSDENMGTDVPRMVPETPTRRRGRPRTMNLAPENPRRRHRNLDDVFLQEPDEPYVDQEHLRDVQDRVLTPLGIAWIAGCQLCRLLYVNEINDLQEYLTRLTSARDRMMAALHAVNPMLLRRKGKLHLLYHLPTCIEMFGPLRSYMTEMHERQNGEIRGRIQRTSKHNRPYPIPIRMYLSSRL